MYDYSDDDLYNLFPAADPREAVGSTTDLPVFEDLPQADYSNEGRNYPTVESTQGRGGSPVNATTYGGSGLDKFLSSLKTLGGKAGDYLSTPQGLMSLLSVLAGAGLGYSQRARPSGGGGTQAFKMPTAPQQRTIVQGKYGPIARYAADGGLMHAYAHGGHVRMEDGGFVMTKRAVDGAGGPQGIAQLVPGARPIRGPGTGTSDSIPASITGPNGVTPAKVSNGEAYVPRAAVQQAGGPERMYALMNRLQRRA